jgi:hypothetical protein
MQWSILPLPRFVAPITFTKSSDIVGDKVGERVGVRGSSGALNVHLDRIGFHPLTLSLSPKSLPGMPVLKYDDYDRQ